MSLIELKQEEVEVVSGAGTFIGDSLIDVANLGNTFLNTRLISSVGVVFSAVGLGKVHQLADSTGLVTSKVLIGAGRLLGGDRNVTQLHYNKEKGEGLYTWLPSWFKR